MAGVQYLVPNHLMCMYPSLNSFSNSCIGDRPLLNQLCLRVTYVYSGLVAAILAQNSRMGGVSD